MLERHHLVLAGGPGRVDEADHAEDVALGVCQRDEVAALPDRARCDEGAAYAAREAVSPSWRSVTAGASAGITTLHVVNGTPR